MILKIKKKGVVVESSLVSIILFVIALIVLLYITGLYKLILVNFSEDKLCEASFIASALSRSFLNIGNPEIDPKCKVHKIRLVYEQKDNIENQFVLQQDYPSTIPSQEWDTYLRIKNWNLNNDLPDNVKYSYFEDYSKESFSNGERINIENPTIEQKKYIRARYNLDKLFAEEMARCWDIVGQGELPLFDNWFRFIDCDKNKPGIQECKKITDWIFAFKNGKIKSYANFCVLCSRIKFDEEVKNRLQGINGYYDSVARWMGNNPISVGNKKSYYDYVYDPKKMSSYAEQIFPKYRTDKAYAITFIRINEYGAINLLKTITGLNKYDNTDIYYINTLKLIPYEDLPKECDYLIASEI